MTAFLSLRTQYENLGDEVINAMLLRELCARTAVIARGSTVPDWYIDNLRETLGPLQTQLEVVSTAAFYGKLLGAGIQYGKRSFLFTSCGDVSGTVSNYRRDGALAALQFLPGLQLGMVGASYSAASPSKSRLLRLAAGNPSNLAVRDRRSQAVLAKQGTNLPVVPDLAFLLPLKPALEGEQVRDLALFQMRDVKQADTQVLISRLKGLVTSAREAGLTPAIAWQVERDETISRHLAEVLDVLVVTPAQTRQGRLQALNSLYDRTAVIYSNRLHGLLVAAARGALPLPLLHRGESKIRGIFEDANLSDLILSVEDPQPFPVDMTARSAAMDRVFAVFTTSALRLRQFFDDLIGPVSHSALEIGPV